MVWFVKTGNRVYLLLLLCLLHICTHIYVCEEHNQPPLLLDIKSHSACVIIQAIQYPIFAGMQLPPSSPTAKIPSAISGEDSSRPRGRRARSQSMDTSDTSSEQVLIDVKQQALPTLNASFKPPAQRQRTESNMPGDWQLQPLKPRPLQPQAHNRQQTNESESGLERQDGQIRAPSSSMAMEPLAAAAQLKSCATFLTQKSEPAASKVKVAPDAASLPATLPKPSQPLASAMGLNVASIVQGLPAPATSLFKAGPKASALPVSLPSLDFNTFAQPGVPIPPLAASHAGIARREHTPYNIQV